LLYLARQKGSSYTFFLKFLCNVGVNDESDDPVEVRANEFAASVLFPKNTRELIPGLRSKSQIRAFAAEIGLSPGIVAGQYQFLTRNWRWYGSQKAATAEEHRDYSTRNTKT